MSLSNNAVHLGKPPMHVLRARAGLPRGPPLVQLLLSSSTPGPVTAPLLALPMISAPPSAPTAAPTAAPTSLSALPVCSHQELAPVWFNSSLPLFDLPRPGGRPEDERKVKLGKTLRILQERLPSLLQSPLPQDVLSPNISLHLFPTTHPYLPAVSGRVGYIAALWTSPIAWGRVPIIGNVRLEILSERMVSHPLHFSPQRPGACGEQLVVKWRTASTADRSRAGTSDPDSNSRASLTEQGSQNLDAKLRGSQVPDAAGKGKTAFTGLFVFEFDKEGRIISHTIEHVDEHDEWEKCVGAKVVGLTDWLIGGIKRRTEEGAGAFSFYEAVDKGSQGGKI
ncbi:hypothetical protein GGR56DRAFT_372347 [Xylariaceae sp. FL0804]|nr:hypothetical protein GGR56DRAFT_372347 [Xylariaceae sp. FL0804]